MALNRSVGLRTPSIHLEIIQSTIFQAKDTPTICIIETRPVANTMAAGGDATGRQKAMDDAKATGYIRYSGFMPSRSACHGQYIH